MSTVKKSLADLPPIRPKRLEELRRRKDKSIDYSDIPETTPEFWKNARVAMPGHAKQAVSLRLDADVLAFFRKTGKGYQTRINAVLRSFVEAHSAPQNSVDHTRD